MKTTIRFLLFIFLVSTNLCPLLAQWVQTNSPCGCSIISLAVSGTNLFAGTDSSVFLSTNNGNSWASIKSGLTTYTYIRSLAIIGTNVLAATATPGYNDASSIFLSTNNGTSWNSVFSTTYDNHIQSLTVDDKKVAAVYDHAVILSIDSGNTWNNMYYWLNKRFSAVEMKGANILIGTSEDGVFLSTNNGVNWNTANNGLPLKYYQWYPEIFDFEIIGTNFIAGTFSGLFLSTNNGTGWTKVESGLPSNATVRAFITSNANIFAGTDSGAFHSTNNGKSWMDIGLRGISISSLALNDKYLFAGTYYYGVLRRPLSQMITDVENNNGDIPFNIVLRQNYPNPFNPSTTISFTVPSKSFVSLKVFDELGREVTMLVNEELSAGIHTQQWNAVNMPSGVYFYRLQVGLFTETKKLVLLR